MVRIRLIIVAVCLVFNFQFLVKSEEVYYNGTHSLKTNQTKVEVTTVKIAEITRLKSNSTNATFVVKEKTAKHFVTSTLSSKVVLIPPAKIEAQIVNHNKTRQAHHAV